MAPTPSSTLGSVYCTINGEEIEITGFENINLKPETTYEYCVVNDPGKCYPTYKSFVEEHCCYRFDDWKPEELPTKDRVYKIIDYAPHDMYTNITIYVIEDIDTEQIYLIGEDGIVKYNQYTGLCGATITADEPITTTMHEWVTIRKGEMEMKNEVLELYAKRERERIENTFRAMKEEEYNNLEAVKRYNELINTFKVSLAELVDEYKNEEPKIFVQTVYENHFGYEINPYLERQIAEKFREDFEAEMKELDERIEEIKAVLSLSNDLEYQKNILIEYGILNKKGVMINA